MIKSAFFNIDQENIILFFSKKSSYTDNQEEQILFPITGRAKSYKEYAAAEFYIHCSNHGVGYRTGIDVV